jgi:hypothetical protein
LAAVDGRADRVALVQTAIQRTSGDFIERDIFDMLPVDEENRVSRD